jgi:Putative lactococcus lactis phage r1t holin
MFTVAFWRATVERAVRGFAATTASVLVVGGQVLDVRGVDWGSALGVGGGAAVVSLLLSLAASQVGGTSPNGSASPSFVSDPGAVAKPPADDAGGHVHRIGGERDE